MLGGPGSLLGPRNFRLDPSPRYLFIAGGIGITPILPVIARAEQAGADWRLVYGGRQRSSMAFLDELAAYGDKMTVAPQDETLLDRDTLLGVPTPDTLVYCCGPEPLLAAVEQRCTDWPRRSLHLERFTPQALTEPVLNESFERWSCSKADSRSASHPTAPSWTWSRNPASPPCHPAPRAHAGHARPRSSKANQTTATRS